MIMARPCAMKTKDPFIETALAVRCWSQVHRGASQTPDLSLHFSRSRSKGPGMLAMAREESGLPIVTEVMSPSDVGLVSEFADILQVGARNMQNLPCYILLGKVKKPILLKRGMMCTVEDGWMAAEHIMASGNHGYTV